MRETRDASQVMDGRPEGRKMIGSGALIHGRAPGAAGSDGACGQARGPDVARFLRWAGMTSASDLLLSPAGRLGAPGS
jgi:hypothetical protein